MLGVIKLERGPLVERACVVITASSDAKRAGLLDVHTVDQLWVSRNLTDWRASVPNNCCPKPKIGDEHTKLLQVSIDIPLFSFKDTKLYNVNFLVTNVTEISSSVQP